MYKYLLIFLILLGFSCKNNKENIRIITEKELAEILIDIHLMDGLSNKGILFDSRTKLDSISIYNSIFQKHNVTRAEFDSSIHWYTLHPKKFSKVYDDVFGSISKLEQDSEDNIALFSNENSETIWQIDDYITVNDTLQHTNTFEVPIEKQGTYLLETKIRILPEDQSEDPKLLAYFIDNENKSTDSIPFTYTNILKSNHSQDFRFTAIISNNSKKTLKIIIPLVQNTNPFYKKNYQITSIRVMLAQTK